LSSASLARRLPDSTAKATATTGGSFFDSSTSMWMIKVFPGEYRITARPDEMLVTVLGSCVSACIRDPSSGIGGMNHFMLPQSKSGDWNGDAESTRYGNFAMEKMINDLIKAGCARQSLEVKVFGGGNVADVRQAVGTMNARFVLQYLRDEGLHCAAQDLGGNFPRRIQYHPATGRVGRRLITTPEVSSVTREESVYAARLAGKPTSGDIELFE
jgi:chemotaxis protein CheD